ncbi:carbamoyl-phosphate synthase large subunit [Candidatus Portiera aleyrodidarum]|uniref:carbamoyl-phosphate synthase large subunit n=1 Tax=Candidatus Portiera aleyrodidarum TaxID=91844 RepID=UPI000C78DC8D|nr:carbamoyl-phosphate synthase large subunit [Candidatus Portiera aleyrodidarum]AUI73155.1 carbamoyl phosphate synthase large subunit [Candidatus Portiera aleyrodidarum]
MQKYIHIKKVLIIGSGPIIIGQACEFDYSGVQACKALREEGIYVILVNSNPATIMTDPQIANSTYIEPINWKILSKIIEKERPDALLATMGGQTALNCALDLCKYGILKKFNVKLIGVNISSIKKAENRKKFITLMNTIGLESPKSVIIRCIKDIYGIKKKIGFPCIIRPSYTMGGLGGGIAKDFEELKEICIRGFNIAPTSELLIDEYLNGWKEYELELLRDKKGNCIIICSIENVDALGVHTGDSITVAPAQTLTDKQYQIMRNASLTILKTIGIDSGGSNVQFGVNPKSGKMVVIEMNPRVSRSSALASKATGFPIAKVAAKLAIGYTLDELKNDIGNIPASFEPTIDYVVTKIPSFNFEKFPKANDRLTTEMKSVGEVMGIGRSFKESLQKAIRSLDIGINGFDNKIVKLNNTSLNKIKKELINPGYERIFYIADALRAGLTTKEVLKYTKIDIWFINQIKELINIENIFLNKTITNITYENLYLLKKQGFSDQRIADLLKVKEKTIRDLRNKFKIHPVYKRVDTCSAEFTTSTAYMYSTYENECEAKITNTSDKIIIIGSGPNKIGQGIEFDYCCVQAAIALRECGYETIMINCNPETVSTDYDISDRLYFEPITVEDLLEIIRKENPKGVIIQFGGQTPLKIIKNITKKEIPIIGTKKTAIDIAEDREKFKKLLKKLKLLQPVNEIAFNIEEALIKAKNIGYPLIVRPSYVIGGRAMEIAYNVTELKKYIKKALKISNNNSILLDKYINKAIEIDIDAVSDGKEVIICGIMQHIEQAGIHSGDSACSLPPFSLDIHLQNVIKTQIKKIAIELKVVGLMNCQLACKNNKVYILEVNPRASRTIPFVSKCIGFSLAKIAATCMIGNSLNNHNLLKKIKPKIFCVKEAVLPFNKFIGVDPVLSPEMKSTGEVMGIGSNFSEAFYKAQISIGMPIIKITNNKQLIALISVSKKDKNKISKIAKKLISLGFNLLATVGTAKVLLKHGFYVKIISKQNISLIFKKYKITYVINTKNKKYNLINKKYIIRNTAIIKKVPYTTTIAGAYAICMALKYCKKINKVRKIQDMHFGVGK